MELVNDYAYNCTPLATIPMTSVRNVNPDCWGNVKRALPNPKWSLSIIAIWNQKARDEIFTQTPS